MARSGDRLQQPDTEVQQWTRGGLASLGVWAWSAAAVSKPSLRRPRFVRRRSCTDFAAAMAGATPVWDAPHAPGAAPSLPLSGPAFRGGSMLRRFAAASRRRPPRAAERRPDRCNAAAMYVFVSVVSAAVRVWGAGASPARRRAEREALQAQARDEEDDDHHDHDDDDDDDDRRAERRRPPNPTDAAVRARRVSLEEDRSAAALVYVRLEARSAGGEADGWRRRPIRLL
eukprot:scaffold706_cov418-Prasinococcus_capsulatus_cf.AAC.51